MRRPTPQQEKIYEAVRSGGAHLVVEALAGTGKTTTAVGCLAGAAKGTGFVAFNKHIAAELQTRLPADVPACTLHTLGLMAVRRAFPSAELDEAKLRKLAARLLPDAYPSARIAGERLAALCKYTLTPERDAVGLDALADHYGVEVDDRDRAAVYKLAGDLVEQSAADLTTLDFDDMVWLPHRLRLKPDQFELLLVDEAQDLSRVQQQLVLDATASGRLVPIGDRRQAIYGFSGADCDSLPRLTSVLEECDGRGCRVLPLTITWRCPHAHVALARRIVPALEAAPDAIDGEVRTASLRQIQADVRPGDLVISRTNAPLVGLTYRLVLAGAPALMRGREIGRGLVGLIRRLKPESCKDLVDRLEDYREREQARLRRKKAPEGQFEALADRCDCLGQLAVQAPTLDALEAFIAEKFDDDARPGAAVVLSSVHRAKGLEADRVYVLGPKNLPMARRNSRPWEVVQESNLAYVCVTRAKKVLTFQDYIPPIFGDRA